MGTTIPFTNMHGQTLTKEIFDTATKKLILMALKNAAKVIQTQDGDIEEYAAYDDKNKETVRIRENYKHGRSTVHFDGKSYTKVDARHFDGSINHTFTDAESTRSTNTINESDFADLFAEIAARATLSK